MNRIRSKGVYLVDFSVAAPDEDEILDVHAISSLLCCGTEQSESEFIRSIFEKSCISSERQWVPKSVLKLALVAKEQFTNVCLGMNEADEEARAITGRCLEELFERSRVDPACVDVLVCVSSQATFLQRTVVQQFSGFREDLEVVTLGGMGCAGGAMSIDFARKFLAKREMPTTMVTVCFESITRAFYTGVCREQMVTNALFRAGASAILFSTDPNLKSRAKFRVDYSTRTYQTDDQSLGSMEISHKSDDELLWVWTGRLRPTLVRLSESLTPRRSPFDLSFSRYRVDKSGVPGIHLPRKDVLGSILTRALRNTMSRVFREILPVGEKLKFLLSAGRRTPNICKAVDHMVVHPGGPAVIDKIGKALGYDAAVESANSINAYYHYGNTSSSGVLYAMAYTESLQGIRRGERVLVLGLGAGFESNAVVMIALRDCRDLHCAWRRVSEDRSLHSLAVNAFVESYRNRNRICMLQDSSAECTLLELFKVARQLGYENPFDDPKKANHANEEHTPPVSSFDTSSSVETASAVSSLDPDAAYVLGVSQPD